jgi:hypothetical protein
VSILAWSLRAALVASVVGNVYLIATGPGTRRVEDRTPTPAPAPAPAVVAPRSFAGTTPMSPCTRSLRAAARRLSDVELKLARKLGPKARFEGGEPDPATQVRLDAFMADVFGGDTAYRVVECRSRVCKLEMPRDTLDWMGPLQEEGGRHHLFDGASFGDEVYVIVHEEARQQGWYVAERVIREILGSPRIEKCKSTPPAKGKLRVKIHLDLDGHFSLGFTGSLAGTPIETCIDTAIDAVLAGVLVPAEIIWPPKLEVGIYP